MSFLKINDPKNRDKLVKEFIQRRKNIQQDNLAERTGETEYAQRSQKLFKPIVETQQEIKKELKAITDITYPKTVKKEIGPSEEQLQTYGPIASRYLTKFAQKEGTDKTFGLYYKKDGPYIGNQRVKISGDDLDISGRIYKGTPGLWNLIISKEPEEYTDQDHENYSEILINTNTMRKNNDPSSQRPKSSKSSKWKNIVGPIWKELRAEKGYVEEVVIPSDPNALVERLELLNAEWEAGNTGLRNETVGIIDELKRQGAIDSTEYKNLSSKFSI